MAKSRDKVQQEGFWDEEVKKPAHDDVVVWVDDNAGLVLRRAFPELFGPQWTTSDVEWAMDPARQARATAEVEAFMEATPRPEPRVKRTTWERVLRDEDLGPRRYARSVGFADLIIEAERPKIFVEVPEPFDRSRPDAVNITLGWNRIGGHYGVLIEAKTELPTRGELIRQLRHYGTVFGGPMVVVSPDDSYAKLLNAQGIRFVQCPRVPA
ncbi:MULTISPECIES: hypothetical protein [unclassified Rhodanobacter]|uniref:hypothetical protein n=1 Tax=unclassified Rhodanobacter TaxID=2621553 RepID=UPI000A611D3A|nr:hypothetical protein [Rhodanobacter sp. FW510-R10]